MIAYSCEDLAIPAMLAKMWYSILYSTKSSLLVSICFNTSYTNIPNVYTMSRLRTSYDLSVQADV